MRDLSLFRYYTLYAAGHLPIVSYESHRYIVPVLWLAHQRRLFDTSLDIVYFDSHPDALEPDDISGMAGHFRQLDDFDDVFDFVSKRFSVCNDDWLKFLMNTGYVNNALLIGGEKDIPEIFSVPYVDIHGRSHNIRRVGSLQDLNIHDLPGKIFLDFDLDYFTYKHEKAIYPWAEDTFLCEFSDSKLTGLLEKTEFVTVARESMFCGGHQSCQQIWNSFKETVTISLNAQPLQRIPI